MGGSVDYPGNFSVAKGPYEDAWVVSPNRRVAFYACPYTIKTPPPHTTAGRGERLVSQKVTRVKGVTVTLRTFRTRDGGYRSMEMKRWPRGWQVAGQRYRTQRDLRQYQAMYLRFKRSIVAFGDV